MNKHDNLIEQKRKRAYLGDMKQKKLSITHSSVTRKKPYIICITYVTCITYVI